MKDEINILDYIKIIKKYIKLIIAIFIATEIITLIFVIKQPKIYEATVTILPPEALREKGTLLISRLPYLEQMASPLSLYTGGTETQVLMALLNSRRMKEDIIEKFNLTNPGHQNETTRASIIKNLTKNTKIRYIRDQNIISITVGMENPELAAKIANFYVENLDRINSELNISSIKPIATILDSATAPDKPVTPKVKSSLMIAGILSLFVGLLLSFFINYLKTYSKTK